MGRVAFCMLFFWLVFAAGHAQTVPSGSKSTLSSADSAKQRTEENLQKLNRSVFQRLDTLKALGDVGRFKDSLKMLSWSDSLKGKIIRKFSKESLSLNSRIDSLKKLNLPVDHLTKKSDSLLMKKSELLSEVNSKQKELNQKITDRYSSWQQSLRTNLNLDSAGIALPGVDVAKNLPAGVNDPLKKLNLPTAQGLPNASQLSGSKTELPELSGLPSLNRNDFAGLGLSKDLTTVDGDLAVPSVDQLQKMDKNIPGFENPLQSIKGKASEYKAMVKDPSKAAENGVGQIGEVNQLNKEITQAKNLQQQNEALQAAEKMKDQDAMKEEMKKQAVDHFLGQEQVLQEIMDQMSKYKKKYSSLGSLSEIKKNDWLPHNGLKGVSFRERLRAGLNFGVQNSKDTLVLDLYPNASYRITGRLEMGVGLMYSLRTVKKDWSLDQHHPLWGLSTFAVVKTFKSVFLRIEVDGNSYPKHVESEALYYRDWRWSFLSGIQTNFKISKSFIGNVQMLYNFDKSLKDVFPERLTARIGVQYKLPKKAAK